MRKYLGFKKIPIKISFTHFPRIKLLATSLFKRTFTSKAIYHYFDDGSVMGYSKITLNTTKLQVVLFPPFHEEKGVWPKCFHQD